MLCKLEKKSQSPVSKSYQSSQDDRTVQRYCALASGLTLIVTLALIQLQLCSYAGKVLFPESGQRSIDCFAVSKMF